MHAVQKAILKTILYADMFNCALQEEELYRKLQSDCYVPRATFRSYLDQMVKTGKLAISQGFYALSQRKHLLAHRQKKLQLYAQKTSQLAPIVKSLQLCPWIEGVFLTGSLGAQNSQEKDDIDLLLITSSHRLWLARIWAVLVTELLHVRRRPKEKNVANKICLNMFLDTQNLRLDTSFQSLFSAHEILHSKPLYTKKNCDQKFMYANKWVLDYLPMSFSFPKKPLKEKELHNSCSFVSIFLNWLNHGGFLLQRAYMKSRMTREKVSLHLAFFHPTPINERILTTFETRKKEFRLI